MKKLLLISIVIAAGCNRYSGDESSVRERAVKTQPTSGIVYRNPRVYNVDYSFELVPDPNKIDRAKDLKLWVPIPREWDTQKAVKIVSVNPPPHAEYEDPEYGNRMLFWDFGKEPEKPSYKVDIKFRLESYEVHAEVDPEHIGPYDKTSKEYALYTRGTHTVSITPKIAKMAKEAVGDETNPYLQGKRIFEFVRKKMRYKITFGTGIQYLLSTAVNDEETGEECYVGACGQYSVLFTALCRAVGIPARSAGGFTGWRPWIREEDIKPLCEEEESVSPSGLAGAQWHGGSVPHCWAEFYISEYGWIPVDATRGIFGRLGSKRIVMHKGLDVRIGPHAPQEQNDGYGFQWILLNEGRVDWLQAAVWDIAKIRTARVKIFVAPDPFPADGLTSYGEKTFPKEDVEKNLRHWRKGVLSWPSRFTRNFMLQHLNLEQFYNDHPRSKYAREAFICHMLRRQLGDEMFFKLVKTYVDLRQKSGQAVPTSRFQELAEDVYGEPLGWFFNQWVNSTELPRLKLEKVAVRKDTEGWRVQGRLLQSGDTTFRLPLEFAIDTKKGREKQKLWVEKKATDFDFRTQNEPQKLIVDPDYEILKIQRMPPSLWWFWDIYPKIIIVYGTLGETEANKTAAERFNSDYLGLDHGIIKADTDVNEADLKTECVFLIGRPETNKIAQQFKDIFPIKFDKNTFTWQGTTYAQPAQAVAQIAENPEDAHNLIIMYAGLSPVATQKFTYSYLSRVDRSYVVFDGDKQLFRGDWEDVDRNLYWNFDTHLSVQSAPNEQ